MLITVIICTYRRALDTIRLLQSIDRQTYRDLEVLVVDGSGEDCSVRDAIDQLHTSMIQVSVIDSEKGLTRQRNVGLRNSNGDIIAFLDDDIVLEPEFFEKVAGIFTQANHANVGGLTGYDIKNFPASVNLRWRLRKLLRVVSSLEPGAADRLGRNVPLSFAQPFTGFRDVAWLPGFCMIYRRSALEGLAFDEILPTYGGEDRDFSMRVGDQHQLLFCGELHLQHLCSTVNRVSGTNQVYQTAFGIGRGFRKRARGWSDRMSIVTYALREFFVEIVAGLKHPSIRSLQAPFARIQGLMDGWKSLQTTPATEGIQFSRINVDIDRLADKKVPAIR